MELIINTPDQEKVVVSAADKGKVLDKQEFKAKYEQAEKLLPNIDKLLKINNFKLTDIKNIKVNDKGESFSALRIGIATANALGYALNIPVTNLKGESEEFKKYKFNLVKPKYNKKPNITTPTNQD
ncbi:hypothetical protein KAJ89_04230 [Candidatus Parcubacteria bacterium]|nr:hypothetical protein [Candidatus Parcubacteria bacterium]